MKTDEGNSSPCCTACKTNPTEFTKVVDLTSAGLVIYRHSINTTNINKVTGNVENTTNTTEDVFILYNTKNADIPSKDYLSEMENRNIPCDRCRQIMSHAYKLLKNIPAINKNEIMGICDHCKSKYRPCHICEETIHNFNLNKDKEKPKEKVREWLSKVKEMLKDSLLDVNETSQNQKKTQPEMSINQIWPRESLKRNRVIDIKELFEESENPEAKEIKISERSRKHFFSELDQLKFEAVDGKQLFVRKSKSAVYYKGGRSNVPLDEDRLHFDDNIMKSIIPSDTRRVKERHTSLTDIPSVSSRRKTQRSELDHDHVSPTSYSRQYPHVTEKEQDYSKTPIAAEITRLAEKQFGQSMVEIDLTAKKNRKLLTDRSPNLSDELKKYASDEALLVSTGVKTDAQKKQFHYYFPKKRHHEKPKTHKSSSELIKDTQDKELRTKKEKMRLNKESNDKKERLLLGQDEGDDRSKSRMSKTKKSVEDDKTKKSKQKLELEEGQFESKYDSKKPKLGMKLSKSESKRLDEKLRESKQAFKEAFGQKQPKIGQQSKSQQKFTKSEHDKQVPKESKEIKSTSKDSKAAANQSSLKHKERKLETSSDAAKESKFGKKSDKNAKLDKPDKENAIKTEKENREKEEQLKRQTELSKIDKKRRDLQIEHAATSDKGTKQKKKQAAMEDSIDRNKNKAETETVEEAKKKQKSLKNGVGETVAESKIKQKYLKDGVDETVEATKKKQKSLKDGVDETVAETKKKQISLNDGVDDTVAESKIKQKSLKDGVDETVAGTKKKQKSLKDGVDESVADTKMKQKSLKDGFDETAEETKKKQKSLKGSVDEIKNKTGAETDEHGKKKISTKQQKEDHHDFKSDMLKKAKEEMVKERQEEMEIKRQEQITKNKKSDKKDNIPIKMLQPSLIFDLVKLTQEDDSLKQHSSFEYGIKMGFENTHGNKVLEISEMIKGQKIITFSKPIEYVPFIAVQEPEVAPIIESENDSIEIDNQMISQPKSNKTKAESPPPKGIIKFALSDRSFIEKGWTILPIEKVVRKMNVYRMHPSRPEFDWFAHNKSKGEMWYDSGDKLADFDDNGRGRWFYKNGRLALEYYDAEETNAQQRFVIFSNGEPDERGRPRPYTVLATFDYLGNGIVFDHSGKIRLKYNQTEGVVLDKNIGPVSHWKWHTLNDPPVLQQVMIDTQMPNDPTILKLGGEESKMFRPRLEDEQMLAIEFDNLIKEKNKKLKQSFRPSQIKMKALKINEHFSLKVLDQATVYLIYRDGKTSLKMNIGMILDHKEIVDTDTVELGEVSNNVEKLPARTSSLEALQKSITYAQRYERNRTERERKLRQPVPGVSADMLTAATTRTMRFPLQTVPSPISAVTRTSDYCKCIRKPSLNVYYNARLS